MNSPIISFMVVIKGPVAKAGSILKRYKIMGIIDPKTEAKTITINNEMDTEYVRLIFPFEFILIINDIYIIYLIHFLGLPANLFQAGSHCPVIINRNQLFKVINILPCNFKLHSQIFSGFPVHMIIQ